MMIPFILSQIALWLMLAAWILATKRAGRLAREKIDAESQHFLNLAQLESDHRIQIRKMEQSHKDDLFMLRDVEAGKLLKAMDQAHAKTYGYIPHVRNGKDFGIRVHMYLTNHKDAKEITA